MKFTLDQLIGELVSAGQNERMKRPATRERRKHADLPNDWHAHKCGCGFTWAHSDDMANNEAAHTCPRCKEVQWWIWSFTDDETTKCCEFIGNGQPKLKKGQQ